MSIYESAIRQYWINTYFGTIESEGRFLTAINLNEFNISGDLYVVSEYSKEDIEPPKFTKNGYCDSCNKEYKYVVIECECGRDLDFNPKWNVKPPIGEANGLYIYRNIERMQTEYLISKIK